MLHNRIKIARILKDIQINELCVKFGKSKAQWSRIENGENEPTVKEVKFIKEYLSLSYDYIFDGKPVTPHDKRCNEALKDESILNTRVRKPK